MALFLGLQKCYAPVWNQGTKSKNLPLQVQCPQRAPSHFKNAVCTKYAKKFNFFDLPNFKFLIILTLFFKLQKCCAHFWNWETKLKKLSFQVIVLRGLLHTFKMRFSRDMPKNRPFFFFGTP